MTPGRESPHLLGMLGEATDEKVTRCIRDRNDMQPGGEWFRTKTGGRLRNLLHQQRGPGTCPATVDNRVDNAVLIT